MRKVLIYIVIMMVSFLACKAQKVGQEAIYGTFYKLNKDKHFSSSYTLKLNPDSTFTFIIKVKDGNPQCNGHWEIVDNEFILLKCDEVSDVTETLTNAYMNQREHIEKADKGGQIIVQRGKDKAYALTPVNEDDVYFNARMVERINESIKQVEEGKVKRISTPEGISDLLGL